MRERLTREERRQRIVQTAMAMIDEHGHQSLSMRALARECGLSAPGLMNYFPDMSSLLTAVVEYRDDRDELLFGDWHIEPGIGRRILDTLVENIIARPKAAALFAMVEAEALDPRNPAHRHFRDRADEISRQFAPILGLEYAQSVELTWQLFHIMDGLQLAWLRDPEAFDLRERWRQMADAIFAAAEPSPLSWDEATEGLPLDAPLAEVVRQWHRENASVTA